MATARLGLSQPLGTDLISLGDDAIRSITTILDASAIYAQGTFAARPSATTMNGKFYYATDVGILYLADGTNWVEISRGGGTPPIGSSVEYAGSADPSDTRWLLEDGRAISRTTYAAAFAVLGTTYGAGDGTTTFNIPDSRGRVTVGPDNMGTAAGAASRMATGNTRGASGGTETLSLLASAIPAHTHAVGTLATAAAGTHDHTFGTLAVTGDGSHTHGVGTLAVTGDGSHTHGVGTYAVATSVTTTVSAHTHDVGTIAGASAGSHSHGGATQVNSSTTTADGGHSHAMASLSNFNVLLPGANTPVYGAIAYGSIGFNSGVLDINKTALDALTTGAVANHSHTVNSHAHVITADGSHTHVMSGTTTSTTPTASSPATSTMSGLSAAATHTHGLSGATAAATHTHGISGSVASTPDHTHTLTGATASTGTGTAFNHMPPYIVKNKIIRVS